VQVIMNLTKSIEKAIQIHFKKMYLRQDNFFKLEGNIKSIFHTGEASTAVLRLRLQDTAIHQSTLQAKSHFAELGMSNSSSIAVKKEEPKALQQYPDQHLDQIEFREPISISLTMVDWTQDDKRLSSIYEILTREHERLRERTQEGGGVNNLAAFSQQADNLTSRTMQETSRKLQDMVKLQSLSRTFGISHPQKRTYTFQDAGMLQQFLFHYRMTIERLLKAMAMDENCVNQCNEKPIHEFGSSNCQARCKLNAEKTLS